MSHTFNMPPIGQLGDLPPSPGQSHTSLRHIFWSHLIELDPILQVPDVDSVGSCRGDRFQVQWWTADDGLHFAMQTLDTQLGQQWEAFAIPVSAERTVAGLRTNWSASNEVQDAHDIWSTAFKRYVGPLTSACRHPSFIEIVAAASNPSGINMVRDDRAQLEHLRHDLEYWQSLARAQEKSARKEVAILRRQSISGPKQAPDSQPPSTATTWRFRDIDRWAAQNAERIVILPRAISATKDSIYDAPEVLYQALELLASSYTQWRLGIIDRSAFDEQARNIGVELRRSVSPAAASAHGDQYFVRWAGAKHFLDQHLTKGVSRDPRYCLRIYFFFDEIAGRVVVGSMPNHLDTGAT